MTNGDPGDQDRAPIANTVAADSQEEMSHGGVATTNNGEVYLGLKKYRVLGTRPIRHDGVDKVTGRAIYGADVQLAGLLHGRVLRSPHAHARIRGISTRRALALPGVEAVVTAADMPDAGERVAALGEG